MITQLAARWVLTTVFAAAGLIVALPRRDQAGSAQSAGRGSNLFCSAMCAALIAMTWRSEPAAATWLQVALFGCAALWFGVTSLAGFGQGRRPSLPDLFHMLMAAAMIWMLTEMPAATGMPPAGAMAPASRAAAPAPVLVISILLAVSCAVASIPWLARAIAPGDRARDPAAASQAAMTAGMAAMLLATL